MDFDIKKFSYRLTVLLDENNMTQTQLANEIGTSNVTICRYVTCERAPRIDVVTKIANYFNVSLDYLLGNSDDKDSKEPFISPDYNMNLIIKELFSLDNSNKLSKKQIELIKKLLLANKDFILSA